MKIHNTQSVTRREGKKKKRETLAHSNRRCSVSKFVAKRKDVHMVESSSPHTTLIKSHNHPAWNYQPIRATSSDKSTQAEGGSARATSAATETRIDGENHYYYVNSVWSSNQRPVLSRPRNKNGTFFPVCIEIHKCARTVVTALLIRGSGAGHKIRLTLQSHFPPSSHPTSYTQSWSKRNTKQSTFKIPSTIIKFTVPKARNERRDFSPCITINLSSQV